MTPQDIADLVRKIPSKSDTYGRMICDEAADLIESLTAELAQVKRERDALISDLEQYDELPCALCEHYSKGNDEIPCKFCKNIAKPMDEDKVSQWQWRGVQEGGAEDV